jgi:hypothetical protein
MANLVTFSLVDLAVEVAVDLIKNLRTRGLVVLAAAH